MRHVLIVLMLSLAIPCASAPWSCGLEVSSTADTSSPEAVLRGYMSAMKAGDWKAAAKYMHPEALATFQRVFEEIVSVDSTDKSAREMLGLAEGQTLESIAPEAAFEKVMHMLTTAAPLMRDLLKSTSATPLGTVREGDVMHVVYRSQVKTEDATMTRVEVLSTKRDGDDWKALLRGDMEHVLSLMLASSAKKPGS